MNHLRAKEKTLAEQIAAVRCKYPHFTAVFTSHNSIKVIGILKPTSRSVTYHFALKYNLTDVPQTKIISPGIDKNKKGENPPHLYPGEKLCLYRPAYLEFSRTDFLSDTIIPWTSLWLYYYEVWHTTDKWLGGGEHPN